MGMSFKVTDDKVVLSHV